MILQALFSSLLILTVSSHRLSNEDLTIDEQLIDAMRSSKDMAFIQSNDTLLVEMDMILTPDEWSERVTKKKRSAKRAALRSESSRWPGGVIPYAPLERGYDGGEIDRIMSAFREYEAVTCLKFVPYQEGVHAGAVKFDTEYGCSAHTGFAEGKFYRNMHPMMMHHGCITRSSLLHELGHVIGLKHEQSRPDRDEYVEVRKQFIDRGKWHNVAKYDVNFIDSRGIDYDYDSIMHYGAYAFANSMEKTIITRDPRYQNRIGHKRGLTLEDITAVNLMYNCLDHCPKKRCPPGAYMDLTCQCMCKLEMSWSNNHPYFPCNSERTAVTPDCEDDEYGDCATAALEGRCDTNDYHMSTKCRRTCAFCGFPVPAPTARPTRRPTRPKKPACGDVSVWADVCARDAAKCHMPGDHSYGWLQKNCKATCGLCPNSGSSSGRRGFRKGGSAGCEDEYGEECKSWKASGSCTSGPYKDVLSKHCKASCGLCGKPEDNKCADKARQCADWKKKRECDTNPVEMEYLCRKTCNACGGRGSYTGAKVGCKDLNDGCAAWAGRGMCEDEPSYMRINCRKSCGAC